MINLEKIILTKAAICLCFFYQLSDVNAGDVITQNPVQNLLEHHAQDYAINRSGSFPMFSRVESPEDASRPSGIKGIEYIQGVLDEDALDQKHVKELFESNPEHFRQAFLRSYEIIPPENLHVVRKVFDDFIKEVTSHSVLTSILTQANQDDPVGILIREFKEGPTLRPSLLMNLRVHQVLAQACNRKSPEYYSLFLHLLNRFSRQPSDFEGAKTTLERYLSQHEGEEESERGKESIQRKRSKIWGIEPSTIYERARKKEEEEGIGKAEGYVDASIAGYDKALLSFARSQPCNERAFPYYLFAAVQRQVAEGYYEIGKMVRDGLKIPGDILRVEKEAQNPEFWFNKAISNQSPDPVAKDFSISAALALAEIYERKEQYSQAIEVYKMLQTKGYIRGFLEHGRILERLGNYQDAQSIYEEEGVGWFGLEAKRKMATTKQERIVLTNEEDRMFKNHFQSLIKMAGLNG